MIEYKEIERVADEQDTFIEREVLKHPAFEMIGFSRVSGGDSTLFGSSIKHNDKIVMKLKHGEQERSLHEDHYYGRGLIAEVEMSYSQFAECITTMNFGDGVPCTIRYTKEDGYIPAIIDNDSKRERFRNEFSDTILKAMDQVQDQINEIQKPLDAIKSLVVSFDAEDNTFSLSLQEKELYISNSLTQSLTEVFVSIGETAYRTETPICFFIDEIQYMKQKELGSLIAALHRTNQLGYPVMIVGAGLPKIYKMLSEEKSYSERLFVYKEIGSLTYEQSYKAIEEPVKKIGVSYTKEAINDIINMTKGYPFFIQQFCQIVYNNVNDKIIQKMDIEKSVDEFFKVLDIGFFRVRYERCSDGEKKFIFAMVKCGELPCTISNIGKQLDKKVRTISPTRAQLINKGIIFPVRHSELDFTVPEFDNYIRRLDEYQQWEVDGNKYVDE